MVPDVDFFKSSPLTHKFGDLFNPPGLTNFLGVVQSTLDICGLSCISFPPFSCGSTQTLSFFLNNRYFPATGLPVTFTWYPDRIVREAKYKNFKLYTITSMAVKKFAVLQEFQIENQSAQKRRINLRFALQGGVTKAAISWNKPLPPAEPDNAITIDGKRNALLFTAKHSKAFSLQGMFPFTGKLSKQEIEYSVELRPGEKFVLFYVNAIGESAKDVQTIYDSLIYDVKAEIEKFRKDWNDELKSIFTPGNERYSGSLPILETNDNDILRVYLTSILNVVYFKRDNPYSVYGRAYDTLMPRFWQSVTFIWDYALSSFTHALLDPAVMKKYLEHWMQLDIYSHFGTEYLTGGPVGNWYSANDFNMMVILKNYLLWTGDFDWLEKNISNKSVDNKTKKVLDYIEQYAQSWKQFKSKNGLADYGEIDNLLECVSTYIHEVAGLNAANVFNLRTAAEILLFAGYKQKSAKLLKDVKDLLQELQKLYVTGKGYWRTRFPDGTMIDVRHSYDFFTILNTIPEDLTDRQKTEMVDFFQKELQTPKWMHALSPADNNAPFSVRPDHQWNGAYPAWPAQSLSGLYRIGKADIAFKWLKSLAKSFNQGPLGQAHFAEDVINGEQGGAKKAPYEQPYITDWACSGGGGYVSVIIESVFGVKPELNGTINAEPQFAGFDPKAELHNLVFRGTKYNVTKNGIIKA